MTPEQEKLMKRLDSKLTYLINKKKTWVKVIVIMKLTGWDSEFMRLARESKLVEWRKNGNTIEYCVESLDPMFLIKKAS